jgi:hypothetical protein
MIRRGRSSVQKMPACAALLSAIWCYFIATCVIDHRQGGAMKGAGGTSGGAGQFFLGLMLMCGGFYLLLNAVVVSSTFGLGARLFGVGGYGLTGGMILVPLVIGVVIIFYDARRFIGWLLALGAFAALVFGVISSVSLNLRTMSAFELICILVMAFGGLGLFLRSLRGQAEQERSDAQARGLRS